MNAEANPSHIEKRLFQIASAFVILYGLALSLAPAVLARSWSKGVDFHHWIVFPTWLLAFWLTRRHIQRRFSFTDPYLLPIVFLLMGWGILTIWRLSPDLAIRQLAWFVIGIGIFNLMLRLPADLNIFRKYKYLFLTAGLALTAGTFVFGTNPTGTGLPLWIGCCGLYLQPSEPLKYLLILFFAAYLADSKVFPMHLIPLLLPTFLLAGLAFALLIVQRDLGTASIIMFTLAVMIYLATTNQKFLVASLAGFLLLGSAGYFLFDVVRLRVDSWLYPWADPAGRSYQVIQSLIAVASGEFFGRGPGMGVPEFVPVAQSDFIFATIAEETGVLGGLGFILLLALFLNRGIQIALNSANRFHRYLAGGLTTIIIAQSILIIGGNLRLNPLTGVTLPFVSYGGSSLVSSLVGVAWLTIISSTTSSEPLPNRNSAEQRGYAFLSILLGSGLVGCALLHGWWGIVREPSLAWRPDNFRLPVSDLYSSRGQILDRSGIPFTTNQGTPGQINRVYQPPPLGNILGYSNLRYGQSGLEKTLDLYLRGWEGSDEFTIWANQLLFGQHPPGRNVKLTLNYALEQTGAALFNGHKGAAVLLNAHNGEILMMGSYPNFDPTTLEETWPTLVSDPNAPLVNKAVQGRYPVGGSLGPLWYAHAQILSSLPEDTADISTSFIYSGHILDCVQAVTSNSWEYLVQAGCPGALASLGNAIGYDDLINIYRRLQIEDPLEYLNTRSPADMAGAIQNPEWIGAGVSGHLISPLQVALAIAPISSGGLQPHPQLILAVDVEGSGWTSKILPSQPQRVFSTIIASNTANRLKSNSTQTWQAVGRGYQSMEGNSLQGITWFTGGSLPYWQGEPIVAVVVLEEDNPALAERIGQALLSQVLSPP